MLHGHRTTTATATAAESAAVDGVPRQGPSTAAALAELTALLRLEYPLAAEQAAVVTAPLDTALVVAGAGSGKTHTMSVRVAWLVWRGDVAPEAVLGLTFTRKAARELAERMARHVTLLRSSGSLPDSVGEHDLPAAQTYHSFAARLVEDNAARLHLDEVRLLGPAGARRLVEDVARGWRGPLSVDLGLSQVVSAVLALAGECAEHRLAPQALAEVLDAELAGLRADIAAGLARRAEDRQIADRLAARRALVPLLEAYTARKRELAVLDHGDQVLLAAEAAVLPEVSAEARERYGAVLLDEYQDTSSAQTDLLAALFGRHPVTAVGDPHQSIFGWRGASAGTIGRFLRRFATADGGQPHQHTLATSWRNPTLVLDVANAVAAPLRTIAGRGLDVPVLVARPGAIPGQVSAAYLDTVDAESDLVADWLAGRRRPGRSQAVLCRRRSEMARFETALRARGLPVDVVGLGGLLDEPAVLDVVAALTAAADPERGDALVRLLTGPRWRLAPADLDGLFAWARQLAGDDRDEVSIVDAVDQLPAADWSAGSARLSPAGRERLADVARVLERVRGALHRPAVEAVSTAVAALGLDIEVGVAAPDVVQARRVLDRFLAEAAGFADHEGRSSLPEFLAWLAVARSEERGLDPGEPPAAADAVQLLTVHAAKGLEWQDVAVVDLTAGGFPASRSAPARSKAWLTSVSAVPWPARGDADSLPSWRRAGAVSAKDWQARLAEFTKDAAAHLLTEERRLAYVAVTRAQAGLLLTGARWGPRERAREPSPFLLEAVEAGAVPRVWADATAEPAAGAVDEAWPWPPDATAAQRALAAAAAAVRAADPETGPARDTLSTEAAQWAPLVDRLLAERDAASGRPAPERLSASQVVALAADPAALLADLARPVPTRPSRAARRGTRFHEWVERRFSSGALIDPDELADAEELPPDEALDGLKARFEASEWADADVVAVELPFSTPLDVDGGRVVLRGRIDAVVRRPDGGLDVVDWKTGAPPAGERARARAVQLAVYRLAVARLYGVELARVGGAFWYGATGRTVRPRRLLSEEGVRELVGRVGARHVAELLRDQSEGGDKG